MSFGFPAAFPLLATALIVILFALLRSRQRRRDVATFFVWCGLRDSVSARSQRLRSLLDPLVFLQLATLIAAVFAIAQPLWTSKHPGFASLAIVVDASASMSTRTDSGITRYEAAVQRVDEILATCPSSSISVILFSKNPRALVAGEADRSVVSRTLAASAPGWEGDGEPADLVSGLAAVGGASAYEQIIFLTDHAPATVPFPLRVETFFEGRDIGITVFSVRENPDGAGVSAFAVLTNGSDESQSLRLEIADETSRTTIETFLDPGEEAAYVVPFPTSRGSRFVASVNAEDASPYDNVRYASLQRSIGLQVRWIGKSNRYLMAALDAAAPIRLVNAPPADLTVVYDADLAALPDGNVLLVHSTVRDVITIGDRTMAGVVAAVADDPLLSGIHPSDIYAERLPLVDVLLPFLSLLSVGENPFALRILDPNRLIMVLPSDLVATNLPITVDFPIFVRNLVALIMPAQPAAASQWTLVGGPVLLASRGHSVEVLGPDGRALALLPEQRAFFPDRPGQYSIRTGGETQVLSVNVDPDETSSFAAAELASTADALLPPLSSQLRGTQSSLWPIVAGAGLVLLLAEFFLHRHTLSERARAR
jgi:hypothetical protein